MLEKMDIIRLEKQESGTFGVVRLNGRVLCLSLEPPDRGNAPDVSCIPPGRYTCRRVDSPRFGRTFEITGVPERTHILFHQGNVAADTRGCVLLGSRFGRLGRERALLESSAAFAAFMDNLGENDEFDLAVREACGEASWT
jgi:hypothetical protein